MVDEQANVARDTVMDVTEEQIARVYAQAYLGAIEGESDRSGLVDELRSLVTDILDQLPDFERTLSSALVSHEQKEQVLDKALGGRASVSLLNFLKVLSAHGRLQILRSVAREVDRQFDQETGRVKVEVRVASPIDDSLVGEVRSALQQKLSVEPIIETHVDPDLIAGLVIKVGDTVYDGSVRTQFERARKSMLERAIESIETHPEQFIQGDTP